MLIFLNLAAHRPCVQVVLDCSGERSLINHNKERLTFGPKKRLIANLIINLMKRAFIYSQVAAIFEQAFQRHNKKERYAPRE